MEGRTRILLFLSGLCFLPVCFPRLYVLVQEPKTWADAQSHCREKYTDLASVNNREESDQLMAAVPANYEVWIGLYEDTESWRWSLEDEGYYGEGESRFRYWNPGEPNYANGVENFAVMISNGRWNDAPSNTEAQFVCYREKSDTDSTSGFILVTETKTWTEAQSHCRKHFTDLASVRNEAENDEIKNLAKGVSVWIGLYRDSWKWSDGSPDLFTNWGTNLPSQTQNLCGTTNEGAWKKHPCDKTLFFVCHKDQTTKQVLRVRVKVKSSSLNLEEAADVILQQLGQKLKEAGLGEDVKLTWRKQPDGKIFKLEEKTEKKKNS